MKILLDIAASVAAIAAAILSRAMGEPDLAEVRAATARFQDVQVALAEAFVRDPMTCAKPPR